MLISKIGQSRSLQSQRVGIFLGNIAQLKGDPHLQLIHIHFHPRECSKNVHQISKCGSPNNLSSVVRNTEHFQTWLKIEANDDFIAQQLADLVDEVFFPLLFVNIFDFYSMMPSSHVNDVF